MSEQMEFDDQWWAKRVNRQNHMLQMLLKGRCSTNDFLNTAGLGHRFACEINELRKRGFDISMKVCTDEGVGGAWYTLVTVPRSENVRVTPAMKAAYYKTSHWRSLAATRKEFDAQRCTLCGCSDELETHHWKYRLFNESLFELQTFCGECHSLIHQVSGIAFPKYVLPDVAEMLGWSK